MNDSSMHEDDRVSEISEETNQWKRCLATLRRLRVRQRSNSSDSDHSRGTYATNR